MDLNSLSAIGSQLQAKSISSRELTQHYLNRIERHDASVRSFVHVDAEQALAKADEWDSRRAKGESVSPLAGIPIAVKDILCTKGMPTTCGSKMLQGYMSPFDAHVVEQLDKAGMIMLGKTNLDEFAMGGSTETAVQGPSHNPWDLERTCGGSSGGSAACVAAGLSPVSIGTDTGGSIRQPAAFCGVCGMKPTYGRVSRYGLIAYGSSLDQAGPFGQTVEDLASVLQAIAGHDPRDSTSLKADHEDFSAGLQRKGEAFTLGVVREHLDQDGLDSDIRKSMEHAIESYRKMGYKIVDIELPHHKYAIPTYYIVATSEASSNLSRYDGAHYGYRTSAPRDKNSQESALVEMYKKSRSEGFGAEVQRRIMLGTYTLSAYYYDAYYLKALKVRRLIRNDYDNAFQKVDAILSPTTPAPAFRLGEKVDDPVQMYLEDLYTVSANLAGIPAIAIPSGFHSSGLPIGFQLSSAPMGETKLLQIANAYHQHVDYKPRWAIA